MTASVEIVGANCYNFAMNKIFFDSVSLRFGRREIFRDVTREILAGRVLGIVGRNGVGKSTFLKLAAKIIRPDAGEVKILGAKSVAAIAPEMKIYDALTARENLSFFAKLRGRDLSAGDIFELGRRVGVDFDTENRAGSFSTGMNQRLKFAILLSVDADIWILDEPTSNLDADGRKIFYEEIRGGADSGKIILLATNDGADLEVCDEILGLPIS